MSQATLTDFVFTPEQYDAAEREYALNETLEDIMESTTQARQRRSFFGLTMMWQDFPDLGVHNEILIMYPVDGEMGLVVADNMLVRNDDGAQRRDDRGSFRVAVEPGTIFLTAEYVSDSDPDKDRPGGESFLKYEQHLQVPYYLLHDENEGYPTLQLFRHDDESYQLVEANTHSRFPVEELFLEIGLIDGMIRYWYHGELLPIPEEVPGILAEKDEQIAEKVEQLVAQGKQLADGKELTTRLQDAMLQVAQANRLDLLGELATVDSLKSLDRVLARLNADK